MTDPLKLAVSDPYLVKLPWRRLPLDSDGQPMAPPNGATVAETYDPVRNLMRAVVEGELPWPLVFSARTGRGKGKAATILRHHVEGLKQTWTLEALLAMSMEFGVRQTREACVYPDLVTLDEVGKRDEPSHAERSMLHNVLDWREYRPLIVITIHDMDWINDKYGDAVASRLGPATWITEAELGKDDRRQVR